jgi:hypothetical protein
MRLRPVVTLALAAAVGALAIGAGAPAQASAYRYWTYWQSDASSWSFATQGPATSVPTDGAVEGWRFAVTTQSGAATDAPRTPPEFDEICGPAAADPGSKRVALIVDFGPAEIAPEGQSPPATIISCVEAAEDASSFDVLQSVAAVQTDGGLICSLGGYPQDECAPVLSDDEVAALSAAASVTPAPVGSDDAGSDSEAAGGPQPTTSEPITSGPIDSGSPVATITVAVLLIVGAAVGVAASRRRGRHHA